MRKLAIATFILSATIVFLLITWNSQAAEPEQIHQTQICCNMAHKW